MASPAPERATVADIAIERLRYSAAGGRPTLFLHPKDGPGDDRDFLNALAAGGLDVHAPWLPGFGRSDRPGDFKSVRDLACFAAAYLEDHDVSDALVVGASFGGWVAAAMMTRDVRRIAGVALIDALGLKFGGSETRDIADFHSLKADDLAGRLWADPTKHGGAREDLEQEEALGLARSEEAFALYGWRPYMHDPGLGRWLKRTGLPALTLWGAEDGIVSPEYGAAYAGLLPDGQFETIANAAHYPTREQPLETARRIVAFAKGL